MADERDEQDELDRRFARYVVSPGLVRELKSRDGDGRHRSRTRNFAAGQSHSGAEEPTARVIIELAPEFPGGVAAAREEVLTRLANILSDERRLEEAAASTSRYNVFADLSLRELAKLTDPDAELLDETRISPIYKIWRDEPLKPFLNRSVRTIKADACLATFGADGAGIVVAVADSGIDVTHPHFTAHQSLDLPAGLDHRDFTGSNSPLTDEFGHGTHVAGIIAGQTDALMRRIRVGEVRDLAETVRTVASDIGDQTVLRGVAPKAKLMSLKVLDSEGRGFASGLISALEYLEDLNQAGRRMNVHVVNLSLGYPFDAAWFAAGHSPLCAAVNRLSRSGVVVVAAAGNDGSTLLQTEGRANRQRVGVDQSINDPGNADEAITVGATHGDAPHRYGVSYFSSRGPTTDGRVKPDLVAPGERILSCAAMASSKFAATLEETGEALDPNAAYFREESGTSMAAPHVAGAVAALLSLRHEFIGRSEAVKAIFMATCTDLKRKPDFQGAGLIDLMRAVQSV